MGSTSSETLPASSSRRTDQKTSDQKEPNQSSTSGNKAFPFSCFKRKPKLRHDVDEVDQLIRLINDDMEYISKVAEKIKDYEDEMPELKGTFDKSLKEAKNTTGDQVTLANDLLYLQKKVSNLKDWMIAKESEAEALKEMIEADQKFITKVSEESSTYMKNTKTSEEDKLHELKEYGGTVVEFRDLKRKVTKEKQRITSKRKDESKERRRRKKRRNQSRLAMISPGHILPTYPRVLPLQKALRSKISRFVTTSLESS